MRDLILVTIVVGSLPFAVARPFIGVLMWTWIGFMNPHRLTWGFAFDMPFAQMIAAATLLGFLFARDRRPIPRTRESLLLVAFWVVVTLSTVFAMFPDLARTDLLQFSKVLLMAFVTIVLCQDRARLRILLLVAAASIGFYGFKGGLFGLATGGQYMVLGPDGSFIGDNNGLGLAFNMTLPLLFFMARDESRRWIRVGLYATFALTILSVLLTYSRGNFLGLGVVLVLILLKSRWKSATIMVLVVGGLLAGSFLPDKWFDRMDTIQNYEEDGSAMGRIYAWRISRELAMEHPLLGGGFRVLQPEVWKRYMPEYTRWHNAHSIYFQVLAEHGFTGLGIFLALVVATLLSLWSVRRQSARHPDRAWMVNYSHMLEVSIIGFLATGAFQNLAYFDLFWFLISIAIILKGLAAEPVAEATAAPTAPAPAPRVPVVWGLAR